MTAPALARLAWALIVVGMAAAVIYVIFDGVGALAPQLDRAEQVIRAS